MWRDEVARLNAELDVRGMGSGEGGGAGSGSGSREVAQIMSSLAPLLQHFAGALQQPEAPTGLQQQVRFVQSLLRLQIGEVVWLRKCLVGKLSQSER